jgi:hypothetical protein
MAGSLVFVGRGRIEKEGNLRLSIFAGCARDSWRNAKPPPTEPLRARAFRPFDFITLAKTEIIVAVILFCGLIYLRTPL